MVLPEKRRKKNEFEELFLNSFPEFFEQAAEAERCAQEAQGKEYLEASIEKGQLCHGEYNQHNVILNQKCDCDNELLQVLLWSSNQRFLSVSEENHGEAELGCENRINDD